MNLYIKKISFFLLSFAFIFTACETEESLTITAPEAEFVLNTPGISNIYLNFALPDNPAFTITWSDEVTGSSSYTIEMAMDAEFTSTISLGSTEKNNFSMTVAELNQVLDDASIKSFTETAIYIRVSTGSVFSNVILLQVSKYAQEAPIITSPDNSFSEALSDANPDLTALTVTWDDPEVGANSVISISYELEIAAAGTDFASVISMGTTEDTSFDVSHDALNDIVLAAGGVADVASDFDIRVNAIATTDSGDLVRTSNLVTISLTAFKGAVPDNLFMVGSHNGWNNADASQQFYTTGNGVFVKVQSFTAGEEFKLLPISGSWNGDWGESKTTAGTLEQDDEKNIAAPGTGTYVVIIDFNTLSIKVADISTLFMVGGHNGWNNADANQQFNTSGNGVFTRIQTFNAGEEFKLLPTSGSWNGDWGESKTDAGALEQDDENNMVAPDAGTYMVTIDFNNLSYNLLEVPAALHLVGSPNGWDNSTAPAFTKLSEGVFEINQALTASDEFKFLPTQGSWANDWGESKTYAGMIVRDDENNVKSPGDGTYKITVDFNKGTVTVL